MMFIYFPWWSNGPFSPSGVMCWCHVVPFEKDDFCTKNPCILVPLNLGAPLHWHEPPCPDTSGVLQKSGNLEIQESGNLESKKVKKVKMITMEARHAQNVGGVLISRRKSFVFFPQTRFAYTPGIY